FKFIYDFLAKDKKSYAEFKHFNNMLLKPAIAEINDVTDLKIIYEPIKKGGRVNIINFSVQTPQKSL
ncbi:MAG TPA: replication initiation protein, partial [Bacteroidia bacterium]|nr:replication initiation protein [Bacteroidia bacterium]